MITLYYADFAAGNIEKLIEDYQSKVDKKRLEKVMRTKSREAKVRSLLAGYLLQLGVREMQPEAACEREVLPLSYRYTEQGKPYLVNYPHVFFSLSHSGTMAACAVSDREIGMDVQKHTEVKEGLAERFFTKEECEMLRKAAAGREGFEHLFFRMWSIKESYIKYTGLGMRQGLDTFSIDWQKQTILEGRTHKPSACFKEIILQDKQDYAVSICSKKKADGIILRRIELQ